MPLSEKSANRKLNALALRPCHFSAKPVIRQLDAEQQQDRQHYGRLFDFWVVTGALDVNSASIEEGCGIVVLRRRAAEGRFCYRGPASTAISRDTTLSPPETFKFGTDNKYFSNRCALAEQPALTRRNKKSRNAKHDEDIDLINLHCMAEGSVPGRPGKVRGGLFWGCSVLRSRASIPRAAGAVPHLCPRSASRMRRFPVRAASSTDTGCDRTLPVVPRPSRPDASFSGPNGRSFDGSF